MLVSHTKTCTIVSVFVSQEYALIHKRGKKKKARTITAGGWERRGDGEREMVGWGEAPCIDNLHSTRKKRERSNKNIKKGNYDGLEIGAVLPC